MNGPMKDYVVLNRHIKEKSNLGMCDVCFPLSIVPVINKGFLQLG